MTKSLAKAIALATVLGASASAHAMNINQDGLGEVLLYPLYTVEEGNSTNIRITNTTGFAKAVKVRFVEGQNSAEVLDFNLYLSPYDQWSGAVTKTENGAKLITADQSCTAPAIPKDGVEFKKIQYAGDGGEQSLARTRVGHLEIIEMGVLDADLEAFVTADHQVPGSAPANCNAIRSKFVTSTDDWSKGTLNTGISIENSGGLYGSANIINVEGSTQISYDALAIDNFLEEPQHQIPGSTAPSLNDGSQSVVFKNGDTATYADGQTAVSALLMKESINNDFVVSDALAAETNWVVTFPTKRHHVITTPVTKPFLNPWGKLTDGNGEDILDDNGKPLFGSCHNVSVKYWDHEEYAPEGTPEIEFSPYIPTPGDKNALCYETNVITFNGKKVLGGEFVDYDLPLSDAYKLGWMQIGFDTGYENSTGTDVEYELPALTQDAAENVKGLPAIGFAATIVRNNGVNENSVRNNYGSAIQHKSKTSNEH